MGRVAVFWTLERPTNCVFQTQTALHFAAVPKGQREDDNRNPEPSGASGKVQCYGRKAFLTSGCHSSKLGLVVPYLGLL